MRICLSLENEPGWSPWVESFRCWLAYRLKKSQKWWYMLTAAGARWVKFSMGFKEAKILHKNGDSQIMKGQLAALSTALRIPSLKQQMQLAKRKRGV